MPEEFQDQFITATDKPALIACSDSTVNQAAQKALRELDYKIHSVSDHRAFSINFSQVRYKVVIIEELFAADKVEKNLSLLALQKMPVVQRRHATIILLGDSLTTFDAMDAFRNSVHAVVNFSEVPLLKQLVERAVTDNDLFLHNFLEVQKFVPRF